MLGKVLPGLAQTNSVLAEGWLERGTQERENWGDGVDTRSTEGAECVCHSGQDGGKVAAAEHSRRVGTE